MTPLRSDGGGSKSACRACRRETASARRGRHFDWQIKELFYGTFKAVRDTDIPIKKNAVTAFIGPSGCGKSTVLRCLNRMNDLVRGFRFNGHVRYHGKDIYDPVVDPVAVRRYIGMVFQQPNPFATASSIMLHSVYASTTSKGISSRRSNKL